MEGGAEASGELYTAVATTMDCDPTLDELAVVSDDQLAALDAGSVGFAVVEHKLALSRSSLCRLRAAGLRELRQLRSPATDAGADTPLRMHHATRAILLANTDHYTAWNARKRHLLVTGVRALDDELLLVDLLLSKHPKSGEAWCHRRWVLSRMQSGTTTSAAMAAVAAHEMDVCAAAARTYPRNYYAWTHRYWALSRLSPELAAAECNTMRQWAAINISDHAGLFYRGSAVLLAVANGTHCQTSLADMSNPHSDDSQPAQVWQLAWEQVTELQARYPGHESMWRHRRWLASIAHGHAQSLGFVAVNRETELQFSESREQEAMAEAAKDGLGEREQRQWRSEARCASCYSRWARVALRPSGLAVRDIG